MTMNLSASSPLASHERPAQASRRVVDAPTRMFHWLFALCFAGAYLSGDSERLRLVHVVLGYSMAGLLVFRLLYGLFGPPQARLSLLWTRFCNAPGWLLSLKLALQQRWQGEPGPARSVNWRQGQGILMTAAILALLLSVLPLTLSGYATYNDWGGEWLEELHEAVGEFMLLLVLLHVALIAGLSLLRGRNLAQPMLTGRQPGAGPDLARRNHGWLALLLLVAVLSYWSWEWQQAPATAMSSSSQQANDEDD
jgi:cytochrome b